jgi:hypothetical protein
MYSIHVFGLGGPWYFDAGLILMVFAIIIEVFNAFMISPPQKIDKQPDTKKQNSRNLYSEVVKQYSLIESELCKDKINLEVNNK